MISKTTRLALAVALSSLAGVAGAQTFTATATVQNAVTITEDTELNFGTLFATRTAAGSASAGSQKLTLAPATGTITIPAPATGAGPAIQSLGGAAAGAYRAPGLPSNSQVLVVIMDNDDIQARFQNATDVAAAACVYDDPETARQDGAIVMAHEIGDPSIGFFCIDMFTSDRAGLLDVGGTAATTGYSLGFGVSELTFRLGATLVAQAPSAAITDGRTYEEGNYSASFDMEVRFP